MGGANMDIASRVRKFINEEILRGEGTAVQRDDDELLNGTLDSVALMHLVAFLEEEFDIEIDDVEIVPENFVNTSSIGELVRRRLEGSAQKT
jgi:acyl carrier protein